MRPSKISFLAIILLLVIFGQAAESNQSDQDEYLDRLAQWESSLEGLQYVPDEIIVVFNSARTLSSLDAATLEGYAISDVFEYRPIAVFKVEHSVTLAEALARLEGKPGIREVMPNLLRHCAFTPNDTLYQRQEYLDPIYVEGAWDVTVGSSTVNVAVVDTGVDVEHPEFAGRVTWKENFFDPDNQGANNVFDDSGHGTGVTGVMVARGNNEAGIAGMCWEVNILAFRACGGVDLTCTIADEARAIDSAVAHGADVINLSLGGVGTNSVETQAIQDAYAADVTIVAASGNGNPGINFVASGDPSYDRANMYYPAAFPEVIGVAALENDNGSITDPAELERATFSNFGEDIVSVAAVGTSIQTTVPYRPKTEVPFPIYLKRDYSRLSGTSFACPQVSGLAALIVSRFPEASNVEVRSMIELNARPMGGPDTDGNFVDDYLGYGLIDAGASVGNSGAGQNIFQNGDFIVGITPSPLFPDDIYIVIECKNGCDQAPYVSYFVQSTGENEAVEMEDLPAHANTYFGRFTTAGSGLITIQILGVQGGDPLEHLIFSYALID